MVLIFFLIEDSFTSHQTLISKLEAMTGVRVVGFAGTELAAIEWLRGGTLESDSAIVDLCLKDGNGLGAIANCRDRYPDQKSLYF